MKKIQLLGLISLLSIVVSAKEYHVSVKGNDTNNGSATETFRTISAAATVAQPGDVITVHKGTYREWVNPQRGGSSNTQRIIYQAAPGEKVELKGSEHIKNWEKVSNGVWKVTLPNSFFGDYNPYKDEIQGDWFYARNRIHHTGEVYLNGKSFYETTSLEKVLHPEALITKADPEGSVSVWYCEVSDQTTSIWANFGKANPNKELVEINARKTCFYPDKQGINYITLSGFHISQAATQWAAPTAEQIGMVATHWNKGWIIENNTITNSKCSGITLGKERSTGHNVWLNNMQKDGSLHYIEVTFNTLRNGWSKENIGSHIVRNNIISNCEQTGICGSMGAAFCEISNNHIYDIWVKRQFDGAEIGGIKFHAAIDTRLMNNRIHNAGRGIWLDWMTQGTRVSGNLLYNNTLEDLFSEVNHGPYLVDNNIMLSPASIREQSEGGAFVHNLIAGIVYAWNEPSRFTPYHLPHSTEIAGLATIVYGDSRYYNNIFVGVKPPEGKLDKGNYGLEVYNDAKQPVYTNGNLYYNQAKPHKAEQNYIEVTTFDPEIILEEDDNNVYLSIKWNKQTSSATRSLVTTQLLGKTNMSGAIFENPDGTPLIIDTDYWGNKRSQNNLTAGPFENIDSDFVKIKL